ncbi:hypothetical protein CAPTEDRAFT_227821 [Capitella teleta]|uniref:Neurotransmitter-gated ion-channel ligand-binding domain-containing protein n=1 Tax=Capitella teleta TaxID=283909 RepID=R7VF17_CAPTE|nr:hypothetical protein CAPTEDRAFT_227821 [Capitella teleta]|eukprot:ELU14906.1 hypothetical protein CAPTEDRAFT_227821 [Capitella teleta]
MVLNRSTMMPTIAREVCGQSHSVRLIEDLLNGNHNLLVRPVHDTSTTTNVTVELQIHQIVELNLKEQYLSIIVYFNFAWYDELLSWIPEDYGGVQKLHLKNSQIWIPDILPYNSVESGQAANRILADTNTIVASTGRVTWMTMALLKTSCNVDVANYPFDTQTCKIKFGSWTFNNEEMSLRCSSNEAGMHNLVANGEWDILSATCTNNSVSYPCCEEEYDDVTLTMVIKRKPMFYIYNLMFPGALLIMMGMLVFLLPSESGEKASLAMTTLLAMTVFMQIIMAHIPASSNVIPLLDQFFGLAMIMLTFSTMMSVLLIRLHFRGKRGRTPPSWVRELVKGLAKVTCMSPKLQYNDIPQKRRPQLYHLDNQIEMNHKQDTPTKSPNGIASSLLSAQLKYIINELDASKKAKEDDAVLQEEWNTVTATLDHLSLVAFVIVVFISSIFVFWPAMEGQ